MGLGFALALGATGLIEAFGGQKWVSQQVLAQPQFSFSWIPDSWLRDTLEAREAEESLRWKMERLAMCESGGNPERINPMDTNGVPAYGLFQYQERTWNEQIAKYNLLPNAEPAEYINFIMDGELQWELTDKILRDGGDRHWGNCLK